MGPREPLKSYTAPPPRRLPPLPAGLKRTRPRSYVEWKALRRWGRLPSWEESPAGYLLRELRERSGFTQRQMAKKLGCSQQAVAQAERATNNPTVGALRAWARACGADVEIRFKNIEHP